MSNAWETTTEDILNIIKRKDISISENQNWSTDLDEAAEEIEFELNSEDHARIEKAVLYGNDLESQTEYAYDELEKILIEKEIIEKE